MIKQSIPLVLGIALLLGGLYFLTESIGYASNYSPTTGKVVSCSNKHITASGAKKHFKNDGEKFFPVVETTNGKQITSNRHYPKETSCTETIGQTVNLLVDPNDPNNAVINGFYDLWLKPLALIVFSAFLLFLYLKKQNPKRSKPFN